MGGSEELAGHALEKGGGLHHMRWVVPRYSDYDETYNTMERVLCGTSCSEEVRWRAGLLKKMDGLT